MRGKLVILRLRDCGGHRGCMSCRVRLTRSSRTGRSALGLLLAGPLLLAAGPEGAGDAPPPIKLKVAGGLADLGQYVRHEQPFWSQRVPEITGGRVRAEIAPFDRS